MMKIGVANERLAQVLEHLELRGLDEPDMRGIHVFAELDKLELEARAQVPTPQAVLQLPPHTMPLESRMMRT